MSGATKIVANGVVTFIVCVPAAWLGWPYISGMCVGVLGYAFLRGLTS